MVNKVTLIGNLGRDPEVRHLESGVAVAKFSIATNESYKDSGGNWQTQTEWHNVVVWRALAERAGNLKKGNLLYVDGKLTTRKYQDANGQDKYTTEVVANYFRVLDRNDSGNRPEAPLSTEAPANSQTTDANNTAEQVADSVDDLPF